MANIKIKVCNLDISTPIDTEVAINGLGGEPDVYYSILSTFEDMTMLNKLTEMIPVYDSKDHV